jgi:radical SAM additional 4Fe4S-binding domain
MWFTNVIKPTHRCNLGCTYCYNDDSRNPVMTPETLERVVVETFRYARTLGSEAQVDFIWHGGEPLIAGLPFYRRAVELQERHACGMPFANSIQTNGILINGQWIEFFREHYFDVSLSLDGPAHIHDQHRQYRDGRGSFSDVMHSIELLRRNGIPHGVCLVITRKNKHAVGEIYDFFAREKLAFNIIPLTRSGAARDGFEDWGLATDEYAGPWIEMFDRWWSAPPENYVQCTDFVRKSRAILKGRPADCIGLEQCAHRHISTDPDGFVYPCATLSGGTTWVYGNVADHTVEELLSTPLAAETKARTTDECCRNCKWRHVCHGGCMSRSIKFFGTHNRRDYYCDSLKAIYDHVADRLRGEEGLDLSRLPPGEGDARAHGPVFEVHA